MCVLLFAACGIRSLSPDPHLRDMTSAFVPYLTPSLRVSSVTQTTGHQTYTHSIASGPLLSTPLPSCNLLILVLPHPMQALHISSVFTVLTFNWFILYILLLADHAYLASTLLNMHVLHTMDHRWCTQPAKEIKQNKSKLNLKLIYFIGVEESWSLSRHHQTNHQFIAGLTLETNNHPTHIHTYGQFRVTI